MLRLCLDPAQLNRAVKRIYHQIPTIEEMLPEFSNAKIFTVLDAKNGFWHLELDERSADLTTFWTPMGVYRWKRMPFGISCAPEIYQKAQQQVISGLRGTRCIADDIVIYGCGSTMEEAMIDHNKNLEAALQRFQERGLKLNRSKAKVALSSVPFFGHILTSEGVKPDPSKILAVHSIPPPNNKKKLMTFLGLITYLGLFVPKLADISAPLRRLTKDTVEYIWDKEAAYEFNQIKHLVSQSPILRYYDPSEPLVIQCDASQLGVGCVLLQGGRPVAYASRMLTKTERNYASIERECLAIVFACKRHDQYVAGRHRVIVETDHKPLENIFLEPITEAPLRLQKMRMILQRYDIIVRYKKGSEMYIADLLSRTATEQPRSDIDAEVLKIEKVNRAFGEIASVNVVEFINISDGRFDEIASETRKDQTLRKLLLILAEGWPEQKEELSDEMLPYRAFQHELTTSRGVIFKGDRILIPKSLRKKMMLVIADSYSDFIEVDFLNDIKTKSVINICKRHFARHGSPQVVVTDNGPQFDNDELRKFAQMWNITHVTSAPYHAQGNGKAESAVKAMKQLYKKCAKTGADFWLALQQHRNIPNAVGTSPNQRIFSRATRSAVPVITNKLQPPNASRIEERIEHLHKVTKASYDKSAKLLPELQIGQNVMMQRRPDLHSQWEKGILVNKFADNSWEVVDKNGNSYRRSAVHVNVELTIGWMTGN
ncbi:uncharacterized protein K02A2.6-like [Wyeomyia smithii]|uniref:uncharacterized protein K02A2.6-like n=1 Tax=Wyeomyia smithii TaxID=174621 RepID=UPI002467C2EA|nr:uncharacterized protein K02A2.6-like [Wyeomyia smithii]